MKPTSTNSPGYQLGLMVDGQIHASGLSRVAVGKAAGIAAWRMWRWCHGKSVGLPFSPQMAAALSSTLGVDAETTQRWADLAAAQRELSKVVPTSTSTPGPRTAYMATGAGKAIHAWMVAERRTQTALADRLGMKAYVLNRALLEDLTTVTVDADLVERIGAILRPPTEVLREWRALARRGTKQRGVA